MSPVVIICVTYFIYQDFRCLLVYVYRSHAYPLAVSASSIIRYGCIYRYVSAHPVRCHIICLCRVFLECVLCECYLSFFFTIFLSVFVCIILYISVFLFFNGISVFIQIFYCSAYVSVFFFLYLVVFYLNYYASDSCRIYSGFLCCICCSKINH